ncbi:hypothetical protein MRX96_052471 [Rhipicephalus microplus]|uniref:Putative lipocal-1 1 n=1 Tax=Rhipicephalus microplus TaxID=6941 RepID=A0A6M2CQS5_RHIMP
MMRIPCFLLILPILRFSLSENIENRRPFEEDDLYFCYQNATDAVGISGKIYVKIQNFIDPARPPPLCDSAERVGKINDTHYNFTLAAEIPQAPNITVKFNTSLVLSKTGNHSIYNAMTYKYTLLEPPKLRKLMYLSPDLDCMIFVDDRNSTDQAKCQLLQPANYINNNTPTECQRVYEQNCQGENVTVYYPKCQNLPEVTVLDLLRKLNSTTTAAPEQC